ncbi:uncharacterized protein [Oscarella lobularis]|uniref:uncharacterized protein isoform X2 n=1 Tax=Oscarella lobularis TaxID=121494 RepID=UPI00331380E7
MTTILKLILLLANVFSAYSEANSTDFSRLAIDCSPTNKSDVIPSNETAADDAVVKLFCNGSYFLRGASVVCEGNAIISGCVDCERIRNPLKKSAAQLKSNGTSVVVQVGVNATVQFACSDGSRSIGVDSVTSRCRPDGSWSNSPPDCESITSCHFLGLLSNGTMSTNSSSFGTVVRFHCNPGFYLVGSQSMTCNSSGEWSHEKPFCQGTQLDHEAPESKCELFNDELASVCKPFRANQTIFVDAARNQTRIAHYVSEIVKRLSFVANSNPAPPQCVTLLIEIVCIYLMPNCRTDSSIIPRVCKESCERSFKHQHLCRQLFDVAVGSFLFVGHRESIHTNFRDFQCFDLPSQDSGSCYDVLLNFPTLPPPTTRATTTSSAVTPSKAKPQCEAKCAFPFTYQGIEYTECTTVGLQYRNFRPWCMTNAANKQTWVNCNCTSTDDTIQVNGTCEMYSGGDVCHSSRAGSLVFVDSRYNQSYLHAETIKLFQENNETLSKLSSPSCDDSLITLYCHLLYPDCLTVTKGSQNYFYPSPLCSDASFTEFGDKGGCASSYREAIAICQSSFAKKSITPIHMVYDDTPNGSQLPSSTDSQCMMLKTPTVTGSPFSIVIVASSASGALVVVIIVAVLLTICACRRRRSQNALTERSSRPDDQGFPLVLLRPSLWDSATETKIRKVAISPDRLQIQDIIGEGTFGKVYKCLLDSSQTVAAKSVKIDPGSDPTKETQSFVMEALRMTDLNHPNVMNLLGICWSPNSDNVRYTSPLVVLPYMMLGDLRTYLRGKRLETSTGDESLLPTTVELVKFGYQVAKGMEYLSARSIVHRDLAARNCMVDWDLKIKVADFGLARALQEDKDYYRMNSKGARIPIRWCALESPVDGLFTIKTDTWSYGVTLWEIVSLGKMPYPGVAVQGIVSFLERGDRLDRPSNCPEEIYEVMNQCWLTEAGERPSFEKIAETLGDYLGTNIPGGYLTVIIS